MVMSVNTNISSLNAQNNLAKSQSKLSTAIERLSSGMKINSAKDDAAGLAISTRFTTQINGLNQAVANANDGISLAQTTESALNEVTNNMQRIRTLAVQSANATNSDSDRQALDAEVQQRLAEITRISQQTTFNGRHVLDGTFGSAAFQIGANVGETISVNLSQGAGASQVGQIAQSASANISSKFASAAGLTLAAGDLTVNGNNVAAGNYADAASLAAAINTAAGGGSTLASVSGNEISFSNTTGTAVTFGGSAAAGLGMTTVAAQTTGGAATAASVDSAAVVSSFDFSGTPATASVATVNGTAGMDYSGANGKSFTVDGTAVDLTTAYASQAAMLTDVQAQLDAGSNGSGFYTVAASGTDGFTITTAASGAGSAMTIAGTDPAFVDSNVAGQNADTTNNKTFSIDGHSVSLTTNVSDMNGLIGAINTALGANASNYSLSDDGGKLKIETTATGAGASIAITGSDASFFGAPVAGGAAGANVPGVATTTGVNTAVTAAAGSDLALASGDLTINGTDMAGTYKDAQSLVDAINSKGIAGVSAYYDSDTKSVHLNSQDALTVDGTKAGAGELGFSGAGATAIAVGSDLAHSNVNTVAGANDTISRIDAALGKISSMRSDLGAVQNRFSSTIANLQTISQNLSASRSQIQDADFAAETANMSSANILQQAGVSVLAQANATTQSVLKLLQ